MSDSLLIPWTVGHQAPLSMGFPRQEYGSGSSFPPPGDLPDLPDPGMESESLALAARFFTAKPPEKPPGGFAAAAAKSCQSCPTLCDPIDGSPQGPPSLGFSRPEHWSGLPFPSPMHESEK